MQYSLWHDIYFNLFFCIVFIHNIYWFLLKIELGCKCIEVISLLANTKVYSEVYYESEKKFYIHLFNIIDIILIFFS